MIDPQQSFIPANLTEEEAGDVYRWMRVKFNWAGTYFSTYDIESAWEQEQDYRNVDAEEDATPLRDITDADIAVMTSGRDWHKWLPDAICLEGMQTVEQIVCAYIKQSVTGA